MTVSKFADEDLNDLIGTEEGVQNGHSETKPLNLDHLSRGNLDVPVQRQGGNQFSLTSLCCAYLAYCCDAAPRCCWGIGIVALLVPSYYLILAVFFNPTEHFGIVNDYSNVNSQYDLTLGKIDHWCIKGDNDSCRCDDPLDPQPRSEFRSWSKAQAKNRDYVAQLIDQGNNTPDVAFLGGSIVEEMSGKWFGETRDDSLEDLKRMFAKKFQKSSGAKLDAVALGIAGDMNPTVLWRIMNGEMPEAFNPKIWWLELGLNDLGRMQCSEEVVVLGVLRVIEEILAKKPDAMIVINALFPLADIRGGLNVGQKDYLDSFQKDLREKSTKKIEAEKLKKDKKVFGRKKAKERAVGKTDHGDAAGVSKVALQRLEEKKKQRQKKEMEEKKTNEKQGGRARKKAQGGHSRALAETVENARELRIFGKARENKLKEIKMRANRNKQKKFNPIHKERKLPLWTAISSINKALKKFANKHDRVFFFDSTEIFTERENANNFVLRTDLVSIRGHPTKKGFEKWEDAIVEKASKMLAATVAPAPEGEV